MHTLRLAALTLVSALTLASTPAWAAEVETTRVRTTAAAPAREAPEGRSVTVAKRLLPIGPWRIWRPRVRRKIMFCQATTPVAPVLPTIG